ncbi:MAG: type II toxin-antitoxin system VapC family toxin [Candidatus Micrarchaeota archaeon]
MKVLIDTSILIPFLKKEASAVSKIKELSSYCEFYTSTINIYEIQKGAMLSPSSKKDLEGIERLCKNLHVLQIDLQSAQKAAQIFAELRKKGKPIDEADYLIAGCALSNGVSAILTGNKKHFEHISGLKVL